MNCKQGDLAIIVKSKYIGKPVTCIKLLSNYLWFEGNFDTWEIDCYLELINGDRINLIPDSYLRPIRDSGKEDEMLSIVSLKEKVKS